MARFFKTIFFCEATQIHDSMIILKSKKQRARALTIKIKLKTMLLPSQLKVFFGTSKKVA